MIKRRLNRAVLFFVMAFFFACHWRAEAASRNLNPSDPMPAFSTVDVNGVDLQCAPTDNTAFLIVFFSPEKRQSLKAITDIEEVLGDFGPMPHRLSFLAVSDDPNAVDVVKIKSIENLTVHVINDNDFKLWGKFGVIASPTVFLVGTDGRIDLIRAGYSYDFAPAIKRGIQVAMGLISETDTVKSEPVKTVTNSSSEAKAHRHVRMAQLLEERGDYEGALSQLEKAVQIDPNAIECLLELGRLYCVMEAPDKAINAVKDLRPSQKKFQVLHAFILGIAYGMQNDFSNAEKYLLIVVELDPKHSRAFYELGKIYQSQGQEKKAAEMYRKSLDIIYGEKAGEIHSHS